MLGALLTGPVSRQKAGDSDELQITIGMILLRPRRRHCLCAASGEYWTGTVRSTLRRPNRSFSLNNHPAHLSAVLYISGMP